MTACLRLTIILSVMEREGFHSESISINQKYVDFRSHATNLYTFLPYLSIRTDGYSIASLLSSNGIRLSTGRFE